MTRSILIALALLSSVSAFASTTPDKASVKIGNQIQLAFPLCDNLPDNSKLPCL
ncbi:MAG: hypothetical protein K1X44_08140 [Alphaproteobacteria bacterium]|nr:hypothetical protein [Alphaproteobacteria bacterium]